jgi:hypothetical protein
MCAHEWVHVICAYCDPSYTSLCAITTILTHFCLQTNASNEE